MIVCGLYYAEVETSTFQLEINFNCVQAHTLLWQTCTDVGKIVYFFGSLVALAPAERSCVAEQRGAGSRDDRAGFLPVTFVAGG